MSTTTLHIPMDKKVREQLETKAKKLGFDSAQAYIRVWAKAEAEGRTIDFGDDWGEPSDEAAARLNKAAEEAIAASEAGELPGFTDVKSMMEYLQRETH